MFLLATNLISETMKFEPNNQVIDWLRENREQSYICVVSIEELHYEQLRMPLGKRRESFGRNIDNIVHLFEGSILRYQEAEAERCADFHAIAVRDGKTPALGDLMIAAIASTHGLTVATRNVKDFDCLPVKTVNPFLG